MRDLFRAIRSASFGATTTVWTASLKSPEKVMSATGVLDRKPVNQRRHESSDVPLVSAVAMTCMRSPVGGARLNKNFTAG